jgi:dTMP kinase
MHPVTPPESPPAGGLFVTLEGGEGAGKSTLIRGLGARLAQNGVSHDISREPGGTPGAEAIRALLVEGDPGRWTSGTEVLLFFAARHDHLERRIRPSLAAGGVVLCDRFSDSTRAYQGAAGGSGAAMVELLDQLVVGPTQPDLTFILDLPPEIGLARAASRGGGEARFEAKALAFHEALRAAYLEIAAANPRRCVVLDASLAPDALLAVAWAVLQERLHGRR